MVRTMSQKELYKKLAAECKAGKISAETKKQLEASNKSSKHKKDQFKAGRLWI